MRALVALLLTPLLLGACGAPAAEERTVTVFAAASLRVAFADVASAYERTHPGVRVRLSVAGSQTLAQQVQQGAPADVLATADRFTMGTAAVRLRGEPRLLAHNQLAVLTPTGNPQGLRTLRDLARPGLRVVVPGPLVPAGRAAASALLREGVVLHPVSEPDAVPGVVNAVLLGEADAGIAYITDVVDGLAATPVPDTATDLVIGAVTADGEGFVAFAVTTEARTILRRHGFS